jgi:hypothetical protein
MVMQSALRPYLTAGVALALAGASLIAVTPVAAPDIQERAVRLTDFPLITPEELFTDTSANLSALQAQIAADPTPVLSAIAANQAVYAQDLTTALQGAGSTLETTLQGLPAALQTAFADLTSGDFANAVTGPFNYLVDGVVSAGLPLLEGLQTILEGITGNLAAVISDDFGLIAITALVPLVPVAAVVSAFAGVGENIVNALAGGNISGVLENLALAPTTLLGAFLNGYLDGPSTDIVAGGLFDPSEGLVADIESTLQSIASTITPASPSVAMAVDPLAGVTSDFSAMLGSGGLGDLSTLFADLGALPAALAAVPADLASLPTDLLSIF